MSKHLLCLALCIALPACSHVGFGTSINLTPNQASATMQKTHTLKSKHSFDETHARLKNAIADKGMTLFADIDHRQAALDAGLDMQKAHVLIFGTPKAGTPLMQKDPTFALHLPLKVLITQTPQGVLVSYYDTRALVAGTGIDFEEVKDTLANAETLIVNTVAQ